MSRISVWQDGTTIFSDAERKDLPLIQRLSPGFEVLSAPPREGFVPNFQRNRHLLPERIERAEAMLRSCALCGRLCRVNRCEGAGACGLGGFAYCMQPFENIGLEPPVNPSINLPLQGCGLRCCFCGWEERLNVLDEDAGRLERGLWEEISGFDEAVSIEVIGGDPACSIPGVLSFLKDAPDGLALPLVWDDGFFGTAEAYGLLEGFVDVFVPDFKFGNDRCSRRLSNADDYWEVATAALETMMGHDARIIVRVLVLGGHYDCCHRNVLEFLEQFRERLYVSVLDQYFPSFQAFKHPELNRLPTQKEIDQVKNLAARLGLRDVNEVYGDFWT